jgi:hypothetical protein
VTLLLLLMSCQRWLQTKLILHSVSSSRHRHLPAYLIAAFVKRMARMALHAPPSGALFVIAFVYNMLKRHPQIQIMLHHNDDIKAGSLLPVDTRKGMRPSTPRCHVSAQSDLWLCFSERSDWCEARRSRAHAGTLC